MANETKQAAERVILGPEHTAQQVLSTLRSGGTDVETVREWAMSVRIDAADVAELGAIAQFGLSMPDYLAVLAAQNKRAAEAAKSAPRAETKRVTISEPGRAVLNGSFKVNADVDGKGGFKPSYFPRELAALVDDLPLLLSAVIDRADEKIAADATVEKESDENKAERAKAGRKFDYKSDRSKRAHKRAGQTALDWTGVDKATTLAKLKRILSALRSVDAK